MATSVGKAFEEAIEKVFKRLKDDYLLGWHRFPDTHSAGGGQIIQPQPSDYLLALPHGSRLPLCNAMSDQRLLFLEAKASEKHRSLQKSAMRPEQRGFVHFYAGMLQLPYLICHYSAVKGEMQLWDGRAVMEDRLDKRRYLLAEFSAGAGRKLHTETVVGSLSHFFGLPHKQQTVKLYKQLYD